MTFFSNGTLRALRHMLPQAEMAVLQERPWHSMTFAGVQLCIELKLRCDNHATVAAEFAEALPVHEFRVPGQLVADIGVSERTHGNCETQLLIDALILED